MRICITHFLYLTNYGQLTSHPYELAPRNSYFSA